MLKLRPISWRDNPAKLKDDIDFNFKTIESYFSEIIQNKLLNLEVSEIDAKSIKINGNDIGNIFQKSDSIKFNIRTDDNKNIDVKEVEKHTFDVTLSDAPVFESIESKRLYLKGRDILDVFITKEQSDSLAKLRFDENDFRIEDDVVSLKKENHISLTSLSSNTISSNEVISNRVSVDSLSLRGKSIDTLFGSHTFVKTDEINLYTSGTDHNPKIHIKEDPVFRNITGNTAHLNEVVSNKIFSTLLETEAIDTRGINLMDSTRISSDKIQFNGLFFDAKNQAMTLGIEPELEISAFKRTSLRIVPKKDDVIHHAILIQRYGSKKDRSISNGNTNFVIKGNGQVGIGIYDTTSKVDIFSENGYDQFRLSNSYTPTSSNDKNGSIGNISWDEDFLYVKTKGGWKRASLGFF